MSELSKKIGDLLDAEDLDSASALVERARNEDPLSAENWVLQSQLALKLKNTHDAMNAVQHALRLSPDFPPAQYQMAYVLRAQSDVEGALDWYAKAFAGHPVLADSLGWCRVMVLVFAKYALALPIAEYWTIYRPDEAAGWFMYGTCRLAMQQKASAQLLQAWSLDSSILDLPNNLGGAYLLEGDLVQAEYWLRVALERQPDDENTRANLDLLRRRQSRIE
ncbi:MAG: tetratricopeptide repeat protein [Gammaproteobacteria bacterium]|nr:tetratricopeptide repeat protein [Gammaproteobacteria bacterium]